jgi:hypothetical protein
MPTRRSASSIKSYTLLALTVDSCMERTELRRTKQRPLVRQTVTVCLGSQQDDSEQKA